MVRKSNYEKAWDRFTEEIDLTEYYSPDEVFEEFTGWLNPQAGKTRGLDDFYNFVESRFKELEELFPSEEIAFRRVAIELPSELRRPWKSQWELALQEETLPKALEVFYRIPRRIWRQTPLEAISRFAESLRRFFI